jgi:hypothetical protein
MVFPSRRPQSFKPVSTSGSVISMTIAIILVSYIGRAWRRFSQESPPVFQSTSVSRTPLASCRRHHHRGTRPQCGFAEKVSALGRPIFIAFVSANNRALRDAHGLLI